MRALSRTVLAVLLVLPLAGCSGDEPEPAEEAVADEIPALEALWQVDLLTPPHGDGGIDAVSQGYFIGAGSIDNSAGTTNPTPNVALDYGIGDAETGEVVSMPPLSGLPGSVEAIPDTDLFVALAPAGWSMDSGQPEVTGYRVGVVDPATASFRWTRRAAGTEVVGLSSTRIYLGRDRGTDPACLTVDEGEVVHDAACRAAALSSQQAVDGISWSTNAREVALPDGRTVSVPATSAQDDTATTVWEHGDLSVQLVDGGLDYQTSVFAQADLGLVRVDYTVHVDDVDRWDSPRTTDAVLCLVDPHTGEVTRTLGRVDGGTLMGFAGDVAIFQRSAAGTTTQAAGYRIAP